MGIGFTAALLVMGCIRELLGSGTVFNQPVTISFMDPIIIFILAPGGFFVYGILVAIVNKLTKGKKAELGCGGCPMSASCSKISKGECGTDDNV